MYAPLKVTTDYSLLQSLIKIPDLINFLHDNNINACAVVDDTLSSSIEFYQTALKNNIKPIIGLSIILNNLEIYLYALNYQGYQNLLKLNTIKQERDIAIVDLEKYKNNMVVIIPYASKELYSTLSFYNNRYIGYQNNYEKSNAYLITNNALYVNDIRAFKVEDLKYLEYLDLLRKENIKEYKDNYYKKESFIDENKINEFISLFNLVIPSKERYIPVFNSSSEKFLEALAFKGLNKRLNNNIPLKYMERLKYELKIIKQLGFVDYFLIVYDYVLYAKKNNILVGCRGSAAGSLVSYSLGITDIDPLPYNLLFERFLNPERITMPDIDIDFDALKRDEVINYVKKKYGYDKVATGLTYATLKSKLVLREIGKLLRINNNLLDKFLKEINGNNNLKENLNNIIIKKYLESYPELKKLYQISLKLEGIKKNTSTHASGIVISSVTLDDVIPVYLNNKELQTGIPLDYIESLGFLKMDFLALKNLTSIANILKRVPEVNIKNINLNDPNVYKLFQSAKTEGIFQFDTPAQQNLLLKLKPNSFLDLTSAVALGRPGPKDHVESFIRRKNGLEKVTYLHPDLEEILKETYGILLYQEQIIAILGKIAGFSYGQADVYRRAIAKKKEDVLLEKKDYFISCALKKGYQKDFILKLYEQILKFADYGFNKSHSVSYAHLAYIQAYLKTYYAPYFIVELLNSSLGFKNNIYLAYLKQKGFKLIKPSINNNSLDYEIKNNYLIMPLNTIKNINNDLAEKILNNKKEGYHDYFDFVLKNKNILNINILTTLIYAGALDCFKLNQTTLLNNMEKVLNYASLDDDTLLKPSIIISKEEKIINKELELYGFYITNHPASKYIDQKYIKLNNINNYLFKNIIVVCLIENIKEIVTKKKEKMAFMKASDETGNVDLTVFPKVYNNINIKENNLVKINGQVVKRFDKISIIVNNISKLED